MVSAIPIVQGFAYVCTLVATLRAGSRLKYMWLHNGIIGAMDGPLIHNGDVDEDQHQLWELTYSLEKVVQLASTAVIEDTSAVDQLTTVKGCHYDQDIMGADNKNTKTKLRSTPCLVNKIDDKEGKNMTLSLLAIARCKLHALTTEINHALQKISQIQVYIYETYASSFHSSWRRLSRRNNSCIRTLVDPQKHIVAHTPPAFLSLKEHNISLPVSTKQLQRDNNNLTELTTRSAQITAVAPAVFQQLRTKFGIHEEEYLKSLKTPFISFQSNSKGAARAGLTFFFSRDGAYMIKSIKRTEAEAFLKMIPSYYSYMKRHARRTLLTRICGMYEISLPPSKDNQQSSSTFSMSLRQAPPKTKKVTLLVMNAVFPALASKFISERYDIKGSTAGRESSTEELMEKGVQNVVMKDMNLAKEVQRIRSISKNFNQYGLNLGARAKASLLSQLRQDALFLSQCGVMDYSLLVGIVKMHNARLLFDLPRCHRSKGQHKALPIQNMDRSTLSIHDIKKETFSYLLRRTAKHVANLFSFPVHAIAAPLLYIVQKLQTAAEVTLSTVLTLPLPYYGAGICGVDGGALSVLHGKRCGQRAVYYLGLIDFLQPWTFRKVIEREVKGLMGYNKHAISCVDPNEYSARFISFLDAHIT